MSHRSPNILGPRALAPVLIVLMLAAGGARAGEMVTFPGGDGGEIAGYLARPSGADPAPAVVVIHEWWGLADWIKECTDRLAGLGYVVLAVDLYDGKVTDNPEEAHELMRALDQQEALANLRGGIAYLRSRDDVDGRSPIGVIGWCMGGGYARLIAQDSDEIGPTAICYGSVATEPDQIRALAGKPVLGIFGAEDRGIPVDRVREFARSLEEAGSTVGLHVYDGAGHGFMRPGGRQFAEQAADDAWEQIGSFFAEHLRPSAPAPAPARPGLQRAPRPDTP